SPSSLQQMKLADMISFSSVSTTTPKLCMSLFSGGLKINAMKKSVEEADPKAPVPDTVCKWGCGPVDSGERLIYQVYTVNYHGIIPVFHKRLQCGTPFQWEKCGQLSHSQMQKREEEEKIMVT
ncbi:hypothetical protein STEG23_017475, partial [Scotinomys teguina]